MEGRSKSAIVVGAILIALGVFFLVTRFAPGMFGTFSWPVIIIGAILAPVAPWVGFSMIWFELIINNVMHTVLFQGDKPTYNPGLVTNCLLLLPYGTWTLLTAAGFFTPLDWVLSIVMGLGIAAFFGTKTRGRLARLKTMQPQAAAG